MKSKILGLLAVVLMAGPMAAQASYLYTFEQTGTSNSVSFTVGNILTGTQDPLTQVIGQTIGGFVITDAWFGPSGGGYCASFGALGTDAINCGLTSPSVLTGSFGQLANSTSVGVYAFSTATSVGGFPTINRLTISEVSGVPEPGTLALLGLGLTGLGLSRRRKAH